MSERQRHTERVRGRAKGGWVYTGRVKEREEERETVSTRERERERQRGRNIRGGGSE